MILSMLLVIVSFTNDLNIFGNSLFQLTVFVRHYHQQEIERNVEDTEENRRLHKSK